MGLNAGQKEAKYDFRKWYNSQNDQVYQLAGPAGTGKTYCASKLIKSVGLESDEILCMAYTGKAALNMTQKGLPASSIHSCCFDYTEIPKLDEEGDPIYRHGRKVMMMGFKQKDFLPKHIKLLYVDEGSFINSEIGNVLLSFGLPIFITYDNEQLPPIYGESFFNKPNYTLTEIVRQAKGSGIIELATRIRLGKEIPSKKYMLKDDCFIFPKREISDNMLLNSEMILCSTNRTRNYFNKRIRKDILKISSKLPVPGDRLLCRSNKWHRVLNGTPLINGSIGTLVRPINVDDINVKDRSVKIDFRPDYIEHDYYDDLPIDIDYFMQDCGIDDQNIYNRAIKMQLGYAITTTMSQGSQWDSVLYFDDVFGDESYRRRSRYTAVTRASKVLMYAY